ncbi:MAG TPA: alkaline phosphatase family protein [Candidatus Eremiobacteraceae bacterium]|nr:alkaline phosphatase family protein [Candidatus Eremiobacteraceae bacterium]
MKHLWLPLKLTFLWMVLLCIAAFLDFDGCGAKSSNAPPTPSLSEKIKHVVIIFQENRTPDNLFQDPVLISRGAEIQSFGISSKGQTIVLTPAPMKIDYDQDHSHIAFQRMYDNGRMDGADLIDTFCNTDAPPPCPPPNPAFQYIQASDAAPYYELAETYTFGDRMFQTNQGPSFPAHQFIISGTSAPSTGSNLFAAENPFKIADPFDVSGCIAPAEERVALITPTGDESQLVYPCFDHPTLTDLLDVANIDWRYYAPLPGIIWNAPNAIQHMCVPNVAPPNANACTGPDWTNHVVLKSSQILTDIANGQLAAMSWVIPTGASSDHAAITDGSGPAWVASIVNAIGNSRYWASIAIIITWDDWGGWYDHVPPPAVINSYEYGFRVPLIVVSPYAKAGYISHQVNDFGSILKFVEQTFELPNVAPGSSPAYADATSHTGDLSDCFDFTQTPLTFQTIPTPIDANHFLEDKAPPVAPDND